MKRSLLRRFVLRASAGAVAVALTLGNVVVPAASAEPSDPGVQTWTPPAEVNRTPAGGPPPARPWRAQGETGAQRTTCLNSKRGVLPWYPLERHQISDRLEVLVNLYNFNVVVAYRELTIKGTGLNLNVDRFYNSQGADGWIHSGTEVGLEDPGFTSSPMRILHGPNGYCVEFAQKADGTFEPAEGLHAKLTKTPEGGYVVSFDSTGERWLFTGEGWFVSQTDRNGNANTNRYHPDGKLASITDSQGRVTTFNHDAQGRDTSITDPTGTTFGNYSYDADGRLTAITDRAGTVIRFGYDTERDLMTSITDGRGNVHRLEYHPEWTQITKLTEPTSDGSGASTTYAEEPGTADRTRVTDPNGHSSVHEFELPGRQIKATDALGHTQSQTWTANSDVNTTTTALQNSTTYNYDALNNLIGTKLPTGAQTTVGYTDSAHPHLPTQLTDGSGNQLTRDYDRNGNLETVRSTSLNADLLTYRYTERLGLVSSRTDGKGAKTTYEYDPAGNLTKVVPPAPAGATTYTYDSLSRLTSTTDGNGVRIDYGYDKLDRVVSIKNGSTTMQANTFDANGNLTRTQTPTVTRTLTYDPRNDLTRVSRGTEVVSYTYDRAGNLATLTTPSGTATYAYDEADRLIRLTDTSSGVTTFGYDSADRRTSTTFPGGAVQATGYDNSGRQTSVTVTRPGGGELLKTTNRYTRPDGSDTDKIQSKTRGAQTRAYGYDGLGRLTSAPGTTYSYDNATNLLSGEGRTYQVNAADQYTKINDTTVRFDGAGNYSSTTNPDTSFTYSPTNQLRTGSVGSSKVMDFSYDTADQTQPGTVIETPTGGTQVTHTFTRTALGVSETVDNGKRSGYTRDPDGLLIGVKDPAGNRYGAITDHQGSVLGLVDTSGNLVAEYDYAAYGAVTATGAAAAANPFRYLGAFQLLRGHYLLGHRVYDSAFARFRGPDPTGQEINPYNYAQGDPINNSDPTGAYSVSDLKSDLGTIADTVAVAGVVGGVIGCAVATAGACLAGAAAGAFYGGAVGLGFGTGIVLFD